MKSLFRRRPIADLQAEARGDARLNRALGGFNLTMLGIGAIIGAGIFVLTGKVAAVHAGPAVVLSFVLAGAASVFAALCYSEFASLVPLSGSAYIYGYATLGEFFAWIIGWDLILEYAVGAITVSIGWSGYAVSFLGSIGIHIPVELSSAYGMQFVDLPQAFASSLHLNAGWNELTKELAAQVAKAGIDIATLPHATSIFNLPAVFIVFVATTLLVVGVRESSRFNNVIVIIKLGVLLMFIIGVFHAINPDNWKPFIPVNTGGRGEYGWSGVVMGAGLAFFAYIGFDAVSTAAQEARNPQRNVPIGIIVSLVICTLLYILVSGVATGVVPYHELNVPAPIALVADRAGLSWMGSIIKIGAIAGLSSTVLVMLFGQSRVFWAMSKDGLLPPVINKVHPRFRTPWITSIVTGILVSIFAGVLRVDDAGNLCSIGTLLAFVIVSVGILLLRWKHPEVKPGFRTPAVWFVAPAGALSSIYLMIGLPTATWIRMIVWFAVGMVVYFGYSHRHSKIGRHETAANFNPDRHPQ